MNGYLLICGKTEIMLIQWLIRWYGDKWWFVGISKYKDNSNTKIGVKRRQIVYQWRMAINQIWRGWTMCRWTCIFWFAEIWRESKFIEKRPHGVFQNAEINDIVIVTGDKSNVVVWRICRRYWIIDGLIQIGR